MGEALAIHLAPEHPELDQPNPKGFSPLGSHGLGAEAQGIVAAAQLATAEGPLRHFLIERPAKGQAAQGLGGPARGPRVVEQGGNAAGVALWGGP